MAAQYPVNPNVYNGGAVSFNSTPFLNLALQQQARKQAREDALDKYYSDQSKAITPTGMRAKDIEGGWAQKAQAWQKLGMQNKKYLLNPALDKYQTVNEFNRLKNELLADAERSKEAAKAEGTIATAKMSGKFNPTDDDMNILNDVGLSIYDQNRKGRSLNELSINRPPFDSAKFLTDIQAGRKRGRVVEKTDLNPKAGLMTEHFVEQYSPEEIKDMAEKAPFILEKDRSANDAFSRMRENPEKLAELQNAYSKYYPGLVDSNEKAAKAYAVLGIGGPTGRGSQTKPYTDPTAAFNRQKELIDYREAAQKRINAAKAASTVKEAHGILNGMMDDLWDEAQKHPVNITANKTGTTQQTFNIPLTEEVAKAGMLPGEKESPDALRFVVKDGKKYVQRVVYQKEDILDKDKYVVGRQPVRQNGKPVLDDSKSTLIPYKQFRDKLGKELFTGKILYNELGQGVSSEDIVMDDEDETSTQQPTSPALRQKATRAASNVEDLRKKYGY